MLAERPEQLDRRLRVRARDVVGDLGEVADRRDARPSATAMSNTEIAADGHAEDALRARQDVALSRPGSRFGARIGTGRVCGTAAGIAPRLIHSRDAELLRELDDVAPRARASGSPARRR